MSASIRPPEQRQIVLGRAIGCDVVLPRHGVGRRHAALRVKDGGVIVEDLDSSMGTWLDGQRLRAPMQIAGRGILYIGSATITFDVEDS